MNSLPKYPFARSRFAGRAASGFTLVEILVAITILAIMVLLLANMLSMVSNTWIYGHARVNNFTKARAMLDLLARDFQSGIFRPDLAAFPSSGTLEFYTQRPGVPTSSGSVRYASLVLYVTPTGSNTTMQRSDGPVLWTDPATYLAFGNVTGFTSTATGATSPTLTERDTAPGVVACQISFVQPSTTAGLTFSGTFVPSTTNGVTNANATRAVSIALVVVDDQTLQKMNTSQITNLQTLLSNAITDNPPLHGTKAYWDTALKSSSMNWNSYPQSMGTGLATFERYVTLPTAP